MTAALRECDPVPQGVFWCENTLVLYDQNVINTLLFLSLGFILAGRKLGPSPASLSLTVCQAEAQEKWLEYFSPQITGSVSLGSSTSIQLFAFCR